MAPQEDRAESPGLTVDGHSRKPLTMTVNGMMIPITMTTPPARNDIAVGSRYTILEAANRLGFWLIE